MPRGNCNSTLPNEAFWKASFPMFWTSKVGLNSFMIKLYTSTAHSVTFALVSGNWDSNIQTEIRTLEAFGNFFKYITLLNKKLLPGLEPGTYQSTDFAANHSATLLSHIFSMIIRCIKQSLKSSKSRKNQKNPILKLKKHGFSENVGKFHLLYLT